MQKLAALPDDATLYCAHEYTQSNARFALAVDPDNAALRTRSAEIDRLRAAGKPTVPMTLRLEKDTNPFLRAPAILPNVDPVEAFAALRKQKDEFKG